MVGSTVLHIFKPFAEAFTHAHAIYSYPLQVEFFAPPELVSGQYLGLSRGFSDKTRVIRGSSRILSVCNVLPWEPLSNPVD